MMTDKSAITAEDKYKSEVEQTIEYVERFDILETINNVGNDEVFTPRKVVDMMLDSLPAEVWANPNYKWLNPASKTGIFEREIAMRLDEGLKEIIPDVEKRRKHILQNMIFSIGQTKFTANVSRRTVYYCCQANRKCDGIKAADGHYVNGYAIGNGTWFNDEEGNIQSPFSDHVIDNKGKCKYCKISKDSKYMSKNQLEKYSYDFIHHEPGKDLQKHLSDRFFNGDLNMKFDIIIGNPPYHLSDNGGGKNDSSATPIYHIFVNNARSLNPKYISMIIPSRWFSGGKGLDVFRESMLNDGHISNIVDFDNFREVFPAVDLAGGACYFLWERDYNSPLCNITNVSKGTVDSACRPLNQFNVLVRSNKAVKIVEKIVSAYSTFLDKRISPRLPFDISTTYKPKESGIPCYFTQKLGLKYVDPKDVNDKTNSLDKWKFLIPKAPIAGQTDFSKPIRLYRDTNTRIAKPGECCSESWLIAGVFDNEQEAKCYKSYFLTKTTQFLILQTVLSQNTTRDNFIFVPDFESYKEAYDDKKLCKIYKLTADEWDLIDSKIRDESINDAVTSNSED